MTILIDTGVSPAVVIHMECPVEEVDALIARYCFQTGRDPKQIVLAAKTSKASQHEPDHTNRQRR